MAAGYVGEVLPEPPEPPDPPLLISSISLHPSSCLPVVVFPFVLLVKWLFSSPLLEVRLASVSYPPTRFQSIKSLIVSIPDMNLDIGLLNFVSIPDLYQNLGWLDFVSSNLSVSSFMEFIRCLGLICMACSKHSPYVPSLPCIEVVTRFTLVFTNSESLVSSFRCGVYCFVDVEWKTDLCSKAIVVFMKKDFVWDFHTNSESCFYSASDLCMVQLLTSSTDACVIVIDVRAIVFVVPQAPDRENLVLLKLNVVQILILLSTSNSFVNKHYGVSYGICSLCASYESITIVVFLSLTCIKADVLVDKALFSLINLLM